MSVDEPVGLSDLLDGLSPETRELVERARMLIHDIAPDVVEVVWPHQRTMGFGVGPKKMSEQYVYVDVYDRHVNLGFYYGADLDDPDGLLAGEGKSMRHIRIESPADLNNPSIRDLIAEAKDHLPRLNS